MRLAVTLATALLLFSSMPVAGQSVKVAFHGGLIDLQAENASVRAILNEWARVGGTRIVNGERLGGGPVTLEFKGVYERQALETLLRGVSGYLLGPRAPGVGGASGFDRILILATSTAPRPAAAAPSFPRPPGPQPLRRPAPTQGFGAVDQGLDDDPDQGVNGPTGAAVPNLPPNSPAELRRRLGQLLQDPDDADDDVPETEPETQAPSNPFGVSAGSARPGVIAPVPQNVPGTSGGRAPGQTNPDTER